MDIRCRICGEPWDNDSLHEEAEASGRTYDAVAADFRARGCKALEDGFGPQRCEPTDPGTQAIIEVATDMAGDDMDGLTSNLDDARFLGLL